MILFLSGTLLAIADDDEDSDLQEKIDWAVERECRRSTPLYESEKVLRCHDEWVDTGKRVNGRRVLKLVRTNCHWEEQS